MSKSSNLPALPDDAGEFILYQTEDGLTRVDVRVFREMVWLSLNQMAELFQRDKSVISRHIANVFEEGELGREGVVAEFATTAADGKTYRVDHYGLDVIISVRAGMSENVPCGQGSVRQESVVKRSLTTPVVPWEVVV